MLSKSFSSSGHLDASALRDMSADDGSFEACSRLWWVKVNESIFKAPIARISVNYMNYVIFNPIPRTSHLVISSFLSWRST